MWPNLQWETIIIMGDGLQTPNEFNTVIDGNGATAINITDIASPVRVDSFWIQNGRSIMGGAIAINRSAPTIANCGMSVNAAWDQITGQVYGAAVSNMDSSTKIINCHFLANESNGDGGAIANFNSNLEITRSIFDRNTAANDGGATYNVDSNAVIKNSVFYNNRANIYGGRGGAIFNDNSTVKIVNRTFYGNPAGQAGGAISSYGSPQPINITNSILWGDSAPTGPEIFDFVSTTLVVYSNVMGGYNGEGNINQDPKFVDTINRDLNLMRDSKCIDSGHSEGAPEFDIGGKFRWDDPWSPNSGGGVPGFYDMGAYEYHPACFGDLNRDGDVDGDDLGFFEWANSNGDGRGDLNSDGLHNWIDVEMMAIEYGTINCNPN